MEAVADHQPAAIGVDLATVRLDIGGDLGLQRRRQHLPGAVADDLIEHRRAGLVGLRTFLDYFEHEGVPSRTSASTPVLIRTAMDFRSSSGRCAPSRHPAEGHPQVLIIARVFERMRLGYRRTVTLGSTTFPMIG